MSNAILVLIALATAVLLNFIYKCTFDYNGLTENSIEKRSTSVEITHSFETRKKIPCLTQSMLYSLNFSSSSQFSTSFFQGQSKKSELLLFACRDGSAVTLVQLATSCEKNWNRWRWWWFCGGFLFPLYFTSSSFSSQMKETRRNDEMSRVFFEIWFVIRTISHFSWLKPSLSAAVASLRFLSDQIRIRTLRRP